ncbi:MAG TPA: hypothetical protein VFS43_00375 [Polyangiaceae bacterium]|nr:hypothetical protein [Polyangiaceae bacterium]
MSERRLLRGLAALAAALVALAAAPRWLAGRGARAVFAGERGALLARARGVASRVEAGVGAGAFHTGSSRFDGEWSFTTRQMALLGLSQVALEHPEARAELLPAVRRAADELVRPEALAFGAEAWAGEGGLESLEGGRGHAYLGYLNLALSMLRAIDPATPHAALSDRLTEALARRLDASPYGVFETYPGETYPPDVAMSIGSLGLYDRATGADHAASIGRAVGHFRARFVERGSGYLLQSVDARTGAPRGPPRGSGTAIAAYALAFADARFASELGASLRRAGLVTRLGFGAIREYPAGVEGGGDVDSGPVLFGVSVSATGFALASARLAGDEDAFVALARTARLFGVPREAGGALRHASGGPLGDAILLAMMSAGPLRAGPREPRPPR